MYCIVHRPSLLRLGRRVPRHVTKSVQYLKQAPTTPSVAIIDQTAWEEFASNVAGEWEGGICQLDSSGGAIELPPLYVPQAFAEWGITLYDWQTQVSSIVKGDSLKVSLKKLMPTVGCEADAIAFVEEASDVFAGDYPRLSMPDGSYTRAPLAEGTSSLAVEHCLAVGEKEGRKRLRLTQNLTSVTSAPLVKTFDLGEEEWSETYNGGRELFACGGGSKKISQTKKLEASLLAGKWAVTTGAVFKEEGAGQWVASAPAGPISALPEDTSAVPGLTVLPGSSYSYVAEADGAVIIEAGWVLEGGQERRASRLTYRAGRLAEAALGVEKRL